MGLADLKSFALKKVSKQDGLAGTLDCCSCLVALVFFLATFFAALASVEMAPSILITSLVVDGVKQNPPVVPYPQFVFCPILPLQGSVFNSQYTDKYPNNKCHGFNMKGDQIPSWDFTVMCVMNSTNSSPNATWEGRVRMYIDKPGTAKFEGCQKCVTGIDGTLLVSNYATFAFFQAHVWEDDDDDDTIVDYQTQSTRLPYQKQIMEEGANDISVVAGYFSKDVWMYQPPGRFSVALAGERTSYFFAFIGGLGLVSYGLYACLSAFLVLLVAGEQK